MDASQIANLRNQLELTSLKLSRLLGISHLLVLDWEAGRKFATRRHVELMRALQATPMPGAPRANESPSLESTPLTPVTDVTLAQVHRRLARDPKLLARVALMIAEEPA